MAHVSTAAAWRFDVERGPDWIFVRPHRIAAKTTLHLPFGEQIWSLLEQHFTHRVVLEMAEVSSLDSELIGQLLWLHSKIHAQDGMMRICGLSRDNQDLLEECKAEGRFPHFRDREEAVMGRPCRPR